MDYILATFLIIYLLYINESNEELLVKDASEGPCLTVSELEPYLYTDLNLVPYMTSDDYYIPMASQALYRHYAEGFLGRPPANKKQLSAMQPVLKCGPLFSTIQNIGFPSMKNPPTFEQTCTYATQPSFPKPDADNVQVVCLGVSATRSNGSKAVAASPSFVSTMDSIIWANKLGTALLVYRCPADNIRDYKILSKTKKLNTRDVAQIKEKIALVGFKTKHITFMKYNSD